MSGSIRPALASLQAASETETEFGGRTRVWTEIAAIWTTITPVGATSGQGEDQRPIRIETARAEARDNLLAAPGQQLVADGEAPWRVLAVQRGQPGRMTLLLDRAL